MALKKNKKLNQGLRVHTYTYLMQFIQLMYDKMCTLFNLKEIANCVTNL